MLEAGMSRTELCNGGKAEVHLPGSLPALPRVESHNGCTDNPEAARHSLNTLLIIDVHHNIEDICTHDQNAEILLVGDPLSQGGFNNLDCMQLVYQLFLLLTATLDQWPACTGQQQIGSGASTSHCQASSLEL